MAAGSATVTESTCYPVKKIQWTWTSGSAGEDGTCTKATTESYYGQVIALVTNPDAGGDAPTDNYTITITDADGYDVMQAATTGNRDDTNTETAVPTATSVAFGVLTLNVSGAGTTNKGVATLYIKDI